jgi:hypothetical protein
MQWYLRKYFIVENGSPCQWNCRRGNILSWRPKVCNQSSLHSYRNLVFKPRWATSNFTSNSKFYIKF